MKSNLRDTSMEPGCSKYDECHFVCINVDATISTYFEDCSVLESLTIINGSFPNHTIPKKWLDTKRFRIKNLFLQDCYITTIKEFAFSANVFKNFSKIWISGSSISKIDQNAFYFRFDDDVNIGKSIKILNNRPKRFYIAYKSFIALLTYNLQELVINNPALEEVSVPDTFRSWFNGLQVSFINLEILDLSENFLTLSQNDFKIFPKLKTLILRNVGLKVLPYNAFTIANFNKLSTINVQDNIIEKLDTKLLDGFLTNDNFEKFYISGNPWKCEDKIDIDFYYIKYPKKFDENVVCEDGIFMNYRGQVSPKVQEEISRLVYYHR